MPSLLGTGISALQAFQQSLATTSHNISNVNTNGFSRQRVGLTERAGEFSGAGFVGQGVDATGVTRVYDQFLVDQVISNTSTQSQFELFFTLASQLDNLLADQDSGISSRLQAFFNATQDVADDPSSIPARTVLLGEAQALADRFAFYDQRLTSIKSQVNTDITNDVTVINGLSQAIADINLSILRSGAAASTGADGGLPNDLLDQRDQLVLELSKHVAVSTLKQDDGSLSIFIGSGQSLVVGTTVQQLGVVTNTFDSTAVDVVLLSGTTQVDVTSQIVGGSLGGSLDFSSRVLSSAERELGRIAIGMTDAFNTQHRLGMDLDSVLGDDFFTALNSGSFTPTVFSSSNNTGSAIVTASYDAVADLTTSAYDLTYNGGTAYTLTRLSDGQEFAVNTLAGSEATLINDGFTLTIGTGAAVGDSFRIEPTANGSGEIGISIIDPRKIAAAVPVRTEASLQNTGAGVIDSGVVTDRAAFVSDTYTIRMADNANATAGLPANEVVDGGGNDLQYQLSINGVQVYTQDEGVGLILGDLTALATKINGVAATGVHAYVDTLNDGDPTNDRLYLVNDPATALPITVTETLVDKGGDPMDGGDLVTGYFGSNLVGNGTTSVSYTFDNTANDYIVFDSGGNVPPIGGSGAYTSGNNITFNGIQTSITGAANLGDIFTIRPNAGGVSDNRNMLALSGVQQQQVLVGGTVTLSDSFGQLISSVGITTRQSEITLDAQTVLLDQSIAARASVSGVNLDEEAANLILYQQAYQAAAQIISVADNLFQTLINAL